MAGKVLYRRFGHEYPTVVYGSGVYLYDRQGRRYLDASGGALVVNIGHGVDEIVQSLSAQAGQVAYAHGTHFTNEPLENYAEELGKVSPFVQPQVYTVSGGSEAVETALKLARHINVAKGEPGRYKFISRWASYHGATLGALSVSGRQSARRLYTPMLTDFAHIAPSHCYRCPFGAEYPACDLECAHALETELIRQKPETVAAFIAEPVVGATLAASVPPPEYWPRIRAICDRYGVLLIADEVMCGMGRTGRWFGVMHWDVVPDIIVTAKGASSGYWPLGVVLVKDRLVDLIRQTGENFAHGFTHANSVMGATVGLGVLRYLQKHDLIAASESMGRYLLKGMGQLLELPGVGNVRGLGLMAGIELVSDQKSKQPFPRGEKVAERVQAEAMSKGLITYIGTGMADGQNGDALLLGPPFIIKEAQIDDLVEVLRGAILRVMNQIG